MLTCSPGRKARDGHPFQAAGRENSMCEGTSEKPREGQCGSRAKTEAKLPRLGAGKAGFQIWTASTLQPAPPPKGFLEPLDLGKFPLHRRQERCRWSRAQQAGQSRAPESRHGIPAWNWHGLGEGPSSNTLLLSPFPLVLLLLLLLFIFKLGPAYGQVDAFLKRKLECAAALPQRRGWINSPLSVFLLYHQQAGGVGRGCRPGARPARWA